MPGGIKISKPERLPKDNISEADLYAWWNELMNYLNQHDNFKLYKEKGMYPTWTAAETDDDRIANLHKDDKGEIDIRQRDLHNFITIIAGCCSRDHYMMVIRQATSLKWIWEELTVIYHHQHKGKEFLTIVDLSYNPSEQSPLSFYNSYRAKILENLKPAGTTVKWKSNLVLPKAETISPTFEDHILLTTLLIIDKRLPGKIKEIYGPRLEQGIFLMDMKVDILSNVTKILDDIEEDSNNAAIKVKNQEFQVSYMGPRGRGRQRGRYNSNYSSQRSSNQQNKFCRLCHLNRKPRNVVLTHEIGDLDCPSMSERDKEGIRAKYSVNAAIHTEEDEEDMLEKMASLHGYGEQVNVVDNVDNINEDSIAKHHDAPSLTAEIVKQHFHPTSQSNIHVIKPVPSQILTVYQSDIPIHLDLDSGCWISTVKLNFARKMKWNIQPNGQLAKIADGKTVLKSKGEIHEVFIRNAWTVKFSAIVMEELHTDAIAGNNFFKDNKVRQDISARTITIQNKYVVPETNRNTDLPTNPINTIVTIPKATMILPEQSINLSINAEDNKTVFVQPVDGIKCKIQPQISKIKQGKVSIINNTNEPVKLSKMKLLIKEVKKVETNNTDNTYKAMSMQTNTTATDNISNISINEDGMSKDQISRIKSIISENKSVFDQNLRQGYNQRSGTHYCKLKFANEERPSSRKVSCVQYNNQMNVLLQKVCDELTDQNVLGIPQRDNIEVQHVMPAFLRKKQKAKDKPNNELTTNDVRLVVNTCELSKYMKSLPAKISKPQDVYNALAKWKYIVKTDLHQGFFQNHLHKEGQKWCGILTPFGGLRFFKRGIQGLINQTEELDELLANLFNDMLTRGKLVKLADDLFTGGNTIDEAMDNLEEMLKICNFNNLKLSSSKTIILPKTVDIMSWIWSQGGTLAPSPHRKQALLEVKSEDILTVKDVRSWIGLYKTFLYHTPNLARIMDPFDKITSDKDSKDTITWTNELKMAFQNAKDNIVNIKEVYLPHPDDQLLIITDGARTPPGVGFVLQAKDKKGNIRTVRHYSVKLKPHHIKWSPCEIESVAFGTAIEAFYDIIKESTKPVIICPDSKPVCDATNLLKKGKFSLSPRIQTFLNNMGKISCEVQHISGKSGQNQIADFQSRNTPTCKAEICQLCNYVDHLAETIIDNKIATVHIDVPYANRESWRNVQLQDKAITLAKNAITTGQLISKKPGKNNSDARKILSNATIATDGLLVVTRSLPFSTTKEERIVIPSSYLPTLINQIHNQSNHPSKHQIKQIFEKYFYGVGVANVIDDRYSQCQVCCAMKKLPNSNKHQSTTNASIPGTHFGCDILKRARQIIMVIRDQFSSYTTADFINDETSESLEKSLIHLVTPIRHTGQIIIRTDQATGFQKACKSKILADLDIIIELGSSLNKNSNAVIDKGIQELEREITAISPGETPIDQAKLAQALMNLNSRLRRNGTLSARSILFSRDDKRMTNIVLDDTKLAEDQLLTREKNNSTHNQKIKTVADTVDVGDHIMLNNNPKKHNIRDMFEIISKEDEKLSIKKVGGSRTITTRKKVYEVPIQHVFKVKHEYQPKPVTKSVQKYRKFDPIRKSSETSDEESDNDDLENTNDESNDIIEDENLDPDDSEDIHENNNDDNMGNNDDSEEEWHEAEDVEKGEKSKKRPQVREKWVINSNDYTVLEDLKKCNAATKIQRWFRKNSYKTNKRTLRKHRIKKTPEVLRTKNDTNEYEAAITTDFERSQMNDSQDTLEPEWDPQPQCTQLYDELNEAFLTADLNLKFKKNSTDMMAVYEFNHVLPLTSELKEKSKSIRKPFKHLKKLVKKRGGTPSNGRQN